MSAQPHPPQAKRQRGAVAILFGIVALLLFGFMALVIDLGRTYVVRTELQNAADAAALAGARQLNQTAVGVTRGVTHAIAMAAQNNVQFSTPVVITAANISVGSCPDDGCMVPASTVTSDGAANGMTFMRVNIESGGLATFFARIPTVVGGTGTATMNTFGRAVAGRFVNNITPIGICGLRDDAGNLRPGGERLPSGELAQFGFRRGVSYNVFQLGPLGAPSDPYLLNPVDAFPNTCTPSNNSAQFVAPFLCTGTSATVANSAVTVYGNTGMEARHALALNSRFDVYTGGGPQVCLPDQAPPDVNIREYRFDTAPRWMTTNQSEQTFQNPGSYSSRPANQHGVMWSYSRAVRAVGTTPDATPGTNFGLTDLPGLYDGVGFDGTYPVSGSPYESVSGPLARAPGNPGRAGRRVLNLVIADCQGVVGSGTCTQIPVLGIGRFFMQRRAVFTGGPGNRRLDVEFAGLIEPVPTAEIKLYR